MRYFIAFLMLLIGSFSASAREMDMFFTAHAEIKDKNITVDFARSNAAGFGVEFRYPTRRSEPYYGFAVSQITSDTQISEYGNPYIMYPVYGYAGYALDLPITPFVEYGIDLVDVMFADTADGERNTVDTYFAIGGMVTLKDIGFVKGYWKRISIRPYLAAPVELFVIGGSLGIQFE